jgi:hypothetical protein
MFFKSFSILITFLIFLGLTIPLSLWGQIDILDSIFENPESIETEINLKTLELYWSADTYAPFGYQGRTLPTQGSLITINADLKVAGGDPKSLTYSWFLDGIFQETKSGYGKDSFKFGIRRNASASHAVLLKVFNETRSFYVEKSINIPIADPEIVIYYKNNSKVNLPYLASAKNFEIASDKEISFLALPYFFNVKNIKDLEFEWTIGKKSVKESSLVANIFGLKIVNKETGGLLEENLKVIATNKSQLNQVIQKIIKLNIY